MSAADEPISTVVADDDNAWIKFDPDVWHGTDGRKWPDAYIDEIMAAPSATRGRLVRRGTGR